jgi:hypothetical protein
MYQTKHPSFRFAALAALSVGLVLASGCTSTTQSQPPRTAIEQLLLSTAVDNALKGVRIPEVSGERVYVDTSFLESYDQGYVIGSIRALLSENGALLESNRDEAEMIIEARSGGLGTDVSDSLVGVPTIPIIIPGAGTSEFPEVVLYSSNKQATVSKIGLLGYHKDGTNAFSTEPLVGMSHFNQYKFLLVLQLNFTDIPERQRF